MNCTPFGASTISKGLAKPVPPRFSPRTVLDSKSSNMKIQENIPLAQFTTFKIGGNARYFCAVEDEEELKEALAYASAKTLPVFVLGGGSNILVSEEGFVGLVIKIEFKGLGRNQPY